jgi:hypothetical protein
LKTEGGLGQDTFLRVRDDFSIKESFSQLTETGTFKVGSNRKGDLENGKSQAWFIVFKSLEISEIHINRTPRSDWNHRNSGGDAAASAEQGKTESPKHNMSWQTETVRVGVRNVCQ